MTERDDVVRITIELRRPTRRASALLVALLALGLPGAALASHAFTDVPDGHPFHDAIGAIAGAGITAGFGDNTYKPSTDVTRQAMAAFMHRGFSRVALAYGEAVESANVSAQSASTSSVFVPVRQLTITVPGEPSVFNPQQLVHLEGEVAFFTSMSTSTPQGCPCEFEAQIRNMTTNEVSGVLAETIDGVAVAYSYALDAEGLFLSAPGEHTFQLEARLSFRQTATTEATWTLSARSWLSAETFPFGPDGTGAL